MPPSDDSPLISPDIDRCWAFVVMISSCVTQILTAGLSYSIAVFYPMFLDEFEESPVFTAWATNINAFIFLVSGEIVLVLVGVFGVRKTFILGCVLSTIGLLACHFARHLITIFMLFGIVGGFGCGCCHFPMFDMMSKYFQRYRAIAFAFSSCGTVIGQFVYPPLIWKLSEVYTPRGAFVVLAGINLNLLVIAATFMPPRELPTSKPNNVTSFGELLKQQGRQQVHNFKLLGRARWLLYCLSTVISGFGFSGFLTHISNYARLLGYSDEASLFLPSVIGIAGLCGRIAVGPAIKFKCVNVVGLSTVLFACFGAANLLVSFGTIYPMLAVACALCGLGGAVYGISPEAIAFILGKANITAGVSYCCLTSAIGILIGGPVSAALYEIDSSYRLSFTTVGVISFLGAFLNLGSCCRVKQGRVRFLPSMERVEEQRENLLNGDQSKTVG